MKLQCLGLRRKAIIRVFRVRQTVAAHFATETLPHSANEFPGRYCRL